MAQTAVEQLVNYMIENFHLTDEALEKFDEALQMEREQMIKFANDYIDDDEELTADQYYTKTFATRLQNETN